MGFNLLHGIKHDTDGDQYTGAAEEGSHQIRHLKGGHDRIRHDRDDTNKQGTHDRNARQYIVQVICSFLARSYPRHKSAVLFQIFRHITGIKNNGRIKITEENMIKVA